MTQDKILDKLTKLKAHAESAAAIGNTAEAEAFASMINTMLLRHELSMEDIPTDRQQAEDPIIEQRIDPRMHGLKYSRSRIGWQERLADVVAEAHMCRLLIHSGTNYVTFVGTKSHVAVAEHAYGVLAGAADRMSTAARDAYWREHRNDPGFESGNYRAAWLRGFISRIAERFREARRKEVAQAPSSSTALVRLNQALVRASNYIDKNYKRKITSARIGRGIGRGERDGRRAADAMKIGQQGVGTSKSAGMIGGK
jgi:hypothetical protein